MLDQLRCKIRPYILNFKNTGWPKLKFAQTIGHTTENTQFWSHVGKAKMCLGVVSLHSLKNCKQTAENCKQTAEKSK